MKSLLLSLLLAGAVLPGQAQDMAVERSRIKAERDMVEKTFAAEERSCRAKFAVTRCTDQARAIRNTALADLKRQERVLNEAERKEAAARRQKELEERTSAQRLQEAEAKRAKAMQDQADREARSAGKAANRAADEAERAAHPKGPRQPAKGNTGPQGSAREARPPKTPTITPAEAAKNREAFEARRKEAEAHKAEVAARAAKRSKPAASGLPVPR